MKETLVILVVGLAPSLVGPHTPNLRRLAEQGGLRPLTTVLPAVIPAPFRCDSESSQCRSPAWNETETSIG